MSPLTAAAIVAAALDLGDREGAAATSMRRIAGELGCGPETLYRHFESRVELLDAVADSAMAEVAVPDAAVAWDERLRRVLTSIRAVALSHPGIAGHVAARPPLGDNGRRLGLVLHGALADGGLPPPTAVRAVQTLVAYVASSVALAEATAATGGRDTRWHEVHRAVGTLQGVASADGVLVVGSDEQFTFGLRLLLDGIRAEAARRC